MNTQVMEASESSQGSSVAASQFPSASTFKNAPADMADLKATKVLLAIDRALDADIRDLYDDAGNIKPLQALTKRQAYLIVGCKTILKNAKAGDGITDEVYEVRLEPLPTIASFS